MTSPRALKRTFGATLAFAKCGLRRAVLGACVLGAMLGTGGFLQAAPIPMSEVRNSIQSLADGHEYLRARLIIRKLEGQKVSLQDWAWIRTLVLKYPQLGSDLILRGDRKHASQLPPGTYVEPNTQLLKADELLLAQKFPEAFETFQKAAQLLKSRATVGRREDARKLLPFAFHGMARALYSSKRLGDALEVYSWIPASYPRYRQILFERMWTAFKMGRVDLALGAIASQRSTYFSKFVEAETYLVQVYLYKSLCRDDDLNQLLHEIADIKWRLETGAYGYEEWAKAEPETRALLSLATEKVEDTEEKQELLTEQQTIRSLLARLFADAKKRLLEDINVAQAYSNLAVTPGMDTGLKPIEKISGREALFKSNLEIWPADDPEEWLDEVGRHRFIGESLCKSKK